MRYETPDEKGAARGRHIDCRLRQIGTARVGMDERQDRLRRLDPGGMSARQLRSGIISRRKDAETFRRQDGRHRCRRRLIEDFVLCRADAEPHAADPGLDPGVLGEGVNELGKNRGSRLGQIEYAQIGANGRRDPGDALLHKPERISNRDGGGELRVHEAPPMRSATSGAILSTSTATPRSFG